MKNWTIILHFGRGHSEVITGLTAEEAQESLRIGVFGNRDCINAQVFQVLK
jgi:hypothetical protein